MPNNKIEPLKANTQTKVIIGVPVNAKSGYIIEKFLKNQKEIQERTPETITVFATEDIGLLRSLIYYQKIIKLDMKF